MSTKPNYDNLVSLGDPQFLHNWKLNVIKFPNKGTYPNPEVISWRCTTSDIPTASVLNASITIKGLTLHYASGIVKYTEQLNLQFLEDNDGTVREFLRQWREVCGKTKTNQGSSKADNSAIFELITLDENDADNWRIRMLGCIYENSNLQSLESGAQASLMLPSLTIKYDIFEDGKDI